MKHFFIIFAIILLTACTSQDLNRVLEQESGIWADILNDARWAQNAHNIQSWKIEIISDTELIGSLDKSRLLPETDPFSRQLILSLGAFSEVARLSSLKKGKMLTAHWIGPEKWNSEFDEEIPLFKWTLEDLQGSETDERVVLIDTLTSPTIKYAVHERDLFAESELNINQNYGTEDISFVFIRNSERVESLKAIAEEAFRIEMETEETRNESIINTRYGRKARESDPYGITLLSNFRKSTVGFIEFFARLFPLKPEAYGKQGIDLFNKALEPSTVLVCMKTKNNTASVQFFSGMEMQAFWMEMIAQDISLLPLSQGLQEYSEVEDQYGQIHEELAVEGETVQMLWSVGQPVKGTFLRSPRLEIADIVASR